MKARFEAWLAPLFEAWFGYVIGVTCVGLVALLGFVVARDYRESTAACLVEVEGGLTAQAVGCSVDVSRRTSYVWAGKTAAYIPGHDGSGSLVCKGVSWAPGAWVKVTCGDDR